jgi:hypothetical protein
MQIDFSGYAKITETVDFDKALEYLGDVKKALASEHLQSSSTNSASQRTEDFFSKIIKVDNTLRLLRIHSDSSVRLSVPQQFKYNSVEKRKELFCKWLEAREQAIERLNKNPEEFSYQKVHSTLSSLILKIKGSYSLSQSSALQKNVEKQIEVIQDRTKRRKLIQLLKSFYYPHKNEGLKVGYFTKEEVEEMKGNEGFPDFCIPDNFSDIDQKTLIEEMYWLIHKARLKGEMSPQDKEMIKNELNKIAQVAPREYNKFLQECLEQLEPNKQEEKIKYCFF